MCTKTLCAELKQWISHLASHIILLGLLLRKTFTLLPKFIYIHQASASHSYDAIDSLFFSMSGRNSLRKPKKANQLGIYTKAFFHEPKQDMLLQNKNTVKLKPQ